MQTRSKLGGVAILVSTAILTPITVEADSMIIRTLDEQLTGIRANPSVKLSVIEDQILDQLVLAVDYPAADANPARRDVWSQTEVQNWTNGRAIAFKAFSDKAIRLSVSFLDRNGVAYTAWAEIAAGEWQELEVPFAAIKPNPYFQPPGANTDAPLDVGVVRAIGFAPQSPEAGRLLITQFVVVD